MAPKFKREDKTPEPGTCGPEMVTLTSHGGSKTFYVPARLLAHVSEYFRAALNSNFLEGTTYEFTLTEHCDDTILAVFTKWVYTRTGNNLMEYDIRTTHVVEESYSVVVKAWLFGDYIRAPEFQNDMMILITEEDPSTMWDAAVLQEFWSRVPVKSKLDILFIDVLARAICDKECNITYASLKNIVDESYPPHVWEELTHRMVDRLRTGRWDLQANSEHTNNYDLQHRVDRYHYLV
ncbi:hypothetical protein F5Y18DRAFT_444308 [Xylariaceae sp. FL1019]|nr:hypothetical protein F5Y18DRAFT_444308 [Xylariaceae sp. FL1019]